MVVAQSNPSGSIESKPSSQFIYSLVGLSFLSTVPVGLVAPIGQAAEIPPVAQPKTKPTSQTTNNQQAVTILHVSPTKGNDAKGNGSQQAPLRTITHALAIAQPNTVILLAPGTYTTQTGEAFPLKLKAGVTLQGNPQLRGQGVVIQGGGEFVSPTFASQNIAIVGADGAGLAGVTVTNPNPRGYGLWIESTNPLVTDNTFTGNKQDGIAVVGNSVSIVRNNHFSANQSNGISVLSAATPQIQGNVFEQNNFGVNIAQNAAPTLIDNKILRNQDGIVVQAEASPKLRRNVFEGNRRDGLVAIANSLPDLGTSTESGDNIFRSNGRLDINANANHQTVPAYGNQVLMTRVAGRVDLVGALAQIKQVAAIKPIDEVKQVAQTKQLAVTPADPAPVLTKGLTPVSVAKAAQPVGRDFVNSTRRTREPSLPPVPRANSQKPAAVGSDLSASSFPVPASLNQPRTVARRPTQVASTTQVSLPTIRTTRSQQAETTIQIPVPPPETNQIATRSARSTPSVRPATPVAATATQLNETTAMPGVAVSPIRVTRRPASTIQPTTRRLASSGRSLPKPRTPINAAPVTKPTTPIAASTSSRTTSPTPTTRTTNAIDISVPPPESSVLMRAGAVDRPTTPPAIVAKRDAVTPSTVNVGSPVSNPELLPVPSPNIPMGNAGNSPEIFIARTPQADGEPPLPPGQINTVSLRYRVVVEAMDEQERSQLRSIVPDAFQTVSSGRSVMQVGAFGDRTNADQLQQMLTAQGLRASVEQL
jgi:parallel beta-helix repeat protein